MSDFIPYTIPANAITPQHIGQRIEFTTADGATVTDTLNSITAVAPDPNSVAIAQSSDDPIGQVQIQFGLKTVRPFYDLVYKRGGEVFDVRADTEVTVYA